MKSNKIWHPSKQEQGNSNDNKNKDKNSQPNLKKIHSELEKTYAFHL